MDPSLSAAGATPTPVLADSKLKIKPFMTSSCPVDKGIICSHFLSDAWCPVVNCPFAHVAASARRAVPQVVCPQWLTARCTNDACPHYHHTQERLNRLHEAGATDYLVVDGAPVRDPMDQETPLTAAQLCGVVPPIGSVAAPVPTLLAPSPIAMMSAAAPPQHPQPMAPQTVLPNPPAYKSIPPPPAYQAAVGRPHGTPTQRPAPPPYASTPKAVMQPVTMVPSPVLAPPGAPMYQPTAYAQPQPMAYPGMPMYMVPTQMPTAPPGYMMVSNQYGQPAYALAPSYGAAPGMPVLQMTASPMMPAMVPQAPPGYAYAAPPPMVYPQ